MNNSKWNGPIVVTTLAALVVVAAVGVAMTRNADGTTWTAIAVAALLTIAAFVTHRIRRSR